MSAEAVHLSAIILSRELAGESHLRLSLLEPETGRREAFYRQAKTAKSTPPDFFDLGEFHLEPGKGGGGWFVKEFRLKYRHSAISQHYANFQAAGEWARFLRRNAVHCHEPETVFEIARKTLSALETTHQPEVALLKGLYLFARQEGWPAKEEWLHGLNAREQDTAATLLTSPLDQVESSAEQVTRLCRSLKNWLATRDEVQLD